MDKKKIIIINGPNLNLLDKRDKRIYGDNSLYKIATNCSKLAKELKVDIDFRQSNSEGEIVSWIQDSSLNKIDAIIINAAAYTHTSIAIRDALEIFKNVKIELHISNIYKREEFRKKSLISDMVDGVISGFGVHGYTLAILGVVNILDEKK